jgi:hypothetical protein
VALAQHICVAQKHLLKYDWKCGDQLDNYKLIKKRKHGTNEIKSFVNAFSDIEGFSFTEDDAICTNCQALFCDRMYPTCQHPNHSNKRKRGDKRRRFLHISATQYFENYQSLGLRPNAAICKQRCFNEDDSGSDSQEEPTHNLKTQVIRDLNAARLSTSPQLTPLSFNKRNKRARARLIEKGTNEIVMTIGDKCTTADIPFQPREESKNIAKFKKDSQDLELLMNKLKVRIQNCSKAEQRSLLTIVPDSWGQKEAAAFFNVPINLIKSSRKQLADAGTILPPIKTKEGRKLMQSTKDLVSRFYKREDVSRCCPGMKDTISVKDPVTGKREHRRKLFVGQSQGIVRNLQRRKSNGKGWSKFISFTETSRMFFFDIKGISQCLCLHSP